MFRRSGYVSLKNLSPQMNMASLDRLLRPLAKVHRIEPAPRHRIEPNVLSDHFVKATVKAQVISDFDAHGVTGFGCWPFLKISVET